MEERRERGTQDGDEERSQDDRGACTPGAGATGPRGCV